MAVYIVNDEGEGPGDIPVTRAGLEHRFIKSAAGFLACTAAKAIPAFRAVLSTDLSDFTEAAQDAVGAMAASSSKVSLTYVDGAPSLTADIVAGSLGPTDIANRTRTIWVNAASMTSRSGGPVLAAQGSNTRYDGWTLRDANVDSLAFTIRIPEDYVSLGSFRIWWTNIGAGSGNVTWDTDIKSVLDTGDLNSATGEVFVTDTFAAPAQDILKVSTTTAAPSISAGSVLRVVCERDGTGGSDSLTNSVAFIGFELVYTADG